jgi:hypothetical protein
MLTDPAVKDLLGQIDPEHEGTIILEQAVTIYQQTSHNIPKDSSLLFLIPPAY